jgi:hypothetical protein
MRAIDALRAVFDEILREARSNPTFADSLTRALGSDEAVQRRRAGRRPAGVLDPLTLYQRGEDELRRQLQGLDIEQLKDIVAEHGMDSSKLAMKWKAHGRLIDLIVAMTKARLGKGDAFRAP